MRYNEVDSVGFNPKIRIGERFFGNWLIVKIGNIVALWVKIPTFLVLLDIWRVIIVYFCSVFKNIEK